MVWPLAGFFHQLNNRRQWLAVVGLGGGELLPQPLPCSEIASWSNITGLPLSAWEAETLLAMDDAYRAGHRSGKTETNTNQGLGEYCHGENIEDCRKTFGQGLADVCATCPN